jgi:hypothetical protein
MASNYDGKTAITFLMIGLGVGALISLFFHPARESKIPMRADLSRMTSLDRMTA